MSVTIVGLKELMALLNAMDEQAAKEPIVLVGTDTEYAFGIETGEHRGGQLARRAGGSHSVEHARQQVEGRIENTIGGALAKGQDLGRALLGLGLWAEGQIKAHLTSEVYNRPIPVSAKGRPKWRRTGNLRASYHTDRLQ